MRRRRPAALDLLVEVARRRQPRGLGVEARVRHGEEVLDRVREHALEPVRRRSARASRASRARRRRSTSAGSRPCARPSRSVRYIMYRTDRTERGRVMPDFDAVVVGASLAGCATAIHLGRAGHRVALVDKRPGPGGLQARLRPLHPVQRRPRARAARRAGASSRRRAPCAGTRACGRRYGWFAEPARRRAAPSLSIRREKLDPLLRRRAAETPGVELLLGHALDGHRADGRGPPRRALARPRAHHAAAGRRRRPRLAHRRARRRADAHERQRALRLLGLLRGPAARHRRERAHLVPRARRRHRHADRRRPDALRRVPRDASARRRSRPTSRASCARSSARCPTRRRSPAC